MTVLYYSKHILGEILKFMLLFSEGNVIKNKYELKQCK